MKNISAYRNKEYSRLHCEMLTELFFEYFYTYEHYDTYSITDVNTRDILGVHHLEDWLAAQYIHLKRLDR